MSGNRLARAYIDTLDDEVELIEVLRAYQKVLDDFMRWFLIRVESVHLPAIRRYSEIFVRLANHLHYDVRGLQIPLRRPIFQRVHRQIAEDLQKHAENADGSDPNHAPQAS